MITRHHQMEWETSRKRKKEKGKRWEGIKAGKWA
jgi:hypothetical protein